MTHAQEEVIQEAKYFSDLLKKSQKYSEHNEEDGSSTILMLESDMVDKALFWMKTSRNRYKTRRGGLSEVDMRRDVHLHMVSLERYHNI